MSIKILMFIELNETVSIGIKEIRHIQSFYKRATEQHLSNNPTDHYRVDRWNAMEYFGIFPKWRTKVLSYLADLRRSQEKVVYVDICGRASGKSLGADVSYLFSLKTNSFKRTFRSDDVFIDGDLFNGNDFSELVKILRLDVPPAFITFMPMAGLQSYTPLGKKEEMPNYEGITYCLLAKRLTKLVQVLRPGGYVMLERPFQLDGSLAEAFLRIPQNQFKLSIAIKKIARKLKCKVEIVSSIGGPYFLIQKNNTK